jgi:gluconate 5-dehydrogenase
VTAFARKDAIPMSTQALFGLKEKVAVVTGGAGHLGTAICEALADAGAHVVIASRSLDKCQGLADRLSETSECLAIQCDVSDESSIRSTIDQAAARWNRLDILVNNAYSGPNPDIPDMTADDFAVALRNGVTAYFIAAQQSRLHMLTTGGGSIINVASMYGMVASYPPVYEGIPFNSPANYHAVKGGVIHLTHHLAAYWAKDKIRVNAISPGAFPAPRVQNASPEFMDRLCEKVPMGRIGQPDEMKGATLFLASEASSYVTGHNLVVDGGWTVW